MTEIAKERWTMRGPFRESDGHTWVQYSEQIEIDGPDGVFASVDVAEGMEKAHLIATAPELLAQCIHLRDVLRLQPEPKLGDWNWPQMADGLDKVIAKATGQDA